MADREDILFPPGRLVAGSVSEPKTTDYEGRPLTVKNGPNTGQPRVEYSFGVAIPKQGEAHWNQTQWGAKLWHVAAAAFPQGQHQQQTFSWKITDGDSQQPNQRNVKPCDREGYPGNWVVYFSSGHPPKTVNRTGTEQIDPKSIERGYYVEVFGNAAGNGATGNQAGIYINHSIVALNAYGDVIYSGPDAAAVGFGSAGTAPGGSATPPPGMANGPATPAPPQQPPAGATTPPPPPAQTGAVQPDHGFVQNAAGQGAAPPPPPPAGGATPPPPPPAAERKFNVGGHVYTEAALLEAGYTPDSLAALIPA